VASFITPLIALIGGKPDFSSLSFTVSATEFPYGQFITALVAFLAIAAVVFFLVVKPVNAALTRLKRDDADPDAPSPEVTVLTEIRDLLRART